MSSTNHTTNYNLSQFLGTDKPAWLTDYNGDMGRIDTAIKNAADAATVADGKGDTANTNIGTMANLTTTEKSTLVGAINEVNSTAGTASTNAGTALSTANAAGAKADTALNDINKFNLSSFSALTPTATIGTVSGADVSFATDSTSSIFKLYGTFNVSFNSNQTGTTTITLGTTSLRPSESYTINAAATCYRSYRNGQFGAFARSITIGTNGVITMQSFGTLANEVANVFIVLPPCLYFNSDFGDVPTPE